MTKGHNPDCSNATASPDELSPPDLKMKSISVTGVTDPDGDPITINVENIMQDEPVQGEGSGNTIPDGAGVGTDTAQVRAERNDTGDGRVYEIGYTATNGLGGTCSGTVEVGVPLDNSGAPAVNSGAIYRSTTAILFFSEAFNGPGAGLNLEDPDGAYVVSGGVIRKGSSLNSSDRRYVRTVTTEYSSNDWIYTIDFDTRFAGIEILFIGVGAGERNPATPFNEPGNAAFFRIHSKSLVGGRIDVAVVRTGQPGFDTLVTIGSLPQDGVFTARIEKAGNQLTFSIDGVMGVQVISIPVFLDDTNTRLFFGNAGIGVRYDDFVVQGADTTPPVVTAPDSVTAEATGPSGASVSYGEATASDAVGVVDGPNCVPVSGSTFAIGESTVTCTASDAAGNEGSDTFTVTVILPPAVSGSLVDAGIDPAGVPSEVLAALIDADQLGLLQVIPSNTTENQDLVLQPDAALVLGFGSALSGNLEGGGGNIVVMGGDTSIAGNIIGVGASFVAGSNVEINGNLENEADKLIVGLGAQVIFSGNVGVATLEIAEVGVVTVSGNLDVRVSLVMGPSSSLDLAGNLTCEPVATVSIDPTATTIFGGNNDCF